MALLAWQAGIQYEGEPDPVATPEEAVALKVWGCLGDSRGCFDWAGLPTVAALLGADDIEGLAYRLMTIQQIKQNQDATDG